MFNLIVLLLCIGGVVYYVRTKRKDAASLSGNPAPPLHLDALAWLKRSWLGNLVALFVIVFVFVFVTSAAHYRANSYQSMDPFGLALLSAFITTVFGAIPLWFVREGIAMVEEKAAQTKARGAGYWPPIEWKDPFTLRTVERLSGNRIAHTFVRKELLRERMKMPQFYLWYFNGDHQENATGWASTVDGNPSVGALGPNSATFLQAANKVNGKWVLELFRVNPEVAANLNRGPQRREKLNVIEYPSEKPITLTVQVGTEGGVFPREIEPAPTGRDTKGSGRKADLSDWEE